MATPLKATVYALVFPTNLQIHIVTRCIHLRIHHIVDQFVGHVFDKRGYPVSVVQAGHHCAQQIDR